MYVSCQMNIRKTTSKPDLSDDMLDVSDEAGQHEVDIEGDVTLESWTGVFPISSSTKSMQVATNPTSIMTVTLPKAPQWQTRLRQ